MTPGARLVQEWWAHQLYAPEPEAQADLARRIDAALAEARVPSGLITCAKHGKGVSHLCPFCETERALAEREAQIAMLVETFRGIADHYSDCNCRAHGMCERRATIRLAIAGDRDVAARAFVERIQAETREECAEIAERPQRGGSLPQEVADYIAAAIRALGPKET